MGKANAQTGQIWSPDNYPSTTTALLTSLRDLRAANPKAVRPTVHVYPPSVYARDAISHGETSASARQRAAAELRERRITSWKMTEHMYFNANNQFPTMARGLFVEDVQDGDRLPEDAKEVWGGEGPVKERIVARGYDKFFNVDEVAWTSWEAMGKHTEAPYRLTLKSNGCLILISALTPEHLLVASKHSLGTTTETDTSEQSNAAALVEKLNGISIGSKGKGKAVPEGETTELADMQHAEAGREWLRRMLQKSGKTEAQLAKRLWNGNLTAVFELCDDSFEEHVIATPAHYTGLHLHGLNRNTPLFSTSSPQEVSAFAEEFGFISTKFIELATISAVKEYAEQVARSGTWEGEMIEGFVVRCSVKDDPTSPADRPPYRPGSPFFFKVKFDEPYLLYRQFREITRTMLPLLESPSKEKEAEIWRSVNRRVKRPEVKVYADWVGRMMNVDPALFDDYNRGIVRVRERFLAWTEGEGKDEWHKMSNGEDTSVLRSAATKKAISREGKPRKWLIVPAAIPGCGKTHVGVALNKLHGTGHTQSDDVTTKKSAPTFLNNVAALFKSHDIVYADRNNHLDKHYEELIALAERKELQGYDLRAVAIVWDIDTQPYHQVLRICCDRVVQRGDNHPTLRPDPETKTEHEAIVGRFLRDYVPPDPASFDHIISVHLQDGPLDTLKAVLKGLEGICGLSSPSDTDLLAAVDEADRYRSTTPYHPPKQRFGKSIRYYGLAVEINLREQVASALGSVSSATTPSLCAAQELFETLVASDRVTDKPHVTFTHEKTVAAEKEAISQPQSEGTNRTTEPGPQEQLWNTCAALSEAYPTPLYKFDLTYLVWDQDIMAFVVENFQADKPANAVEQVGAIPTSLEVPDELRGRLHITVGTRGAEVGAYEAKRVVLAVRDAVGRHVVEEAGSDAQAGELEMEGKKVGWIRLRGLSGEGQIKGMW